MVISKYLAGLIQIAVILVTSLGAALTDNLFSPVESFQVGALVVGAIVTVFVPLLQGAWAGGLKVGGAALGAILAAIVPIIDVSNGGPGWTPSAIMIVVLAGLNALATQLGVSVRIDSAKQAIASPQVSDSAVFTLDPSAFVIADRALPESIRSTNVLAESDPRAVG